MAGGSGVPWWKTTTVYQIYPRSFADANGDGIGDLPGILSRLDYLHDLGIETIWLSPVYQSPQADFGYDVSGHFDIAPEYGSMEDCRRLIDEIHRRGMRVVFDMVLNHTSDQHPWFLESRSSRTSPRRDFYIWRDGQKRRRGSAPPNNWRSMLGPNGWQYDPATDQWYWASFLPFQPDLNYRNPAVKAAMLDVVRHWLALGVDGLRLDVFNALYKDASFSDNPPSLRPLPSEDNPAGFFQRPLHTIDHPDTLAFARELRRVVDEFDSPPRMLVGEVFGPAEVLRQYCGEDADGLHLVFLFQTLRARFTAGAFRELIDQFEQSFPEPFHPTYVFGNHDRPRAIEKLGRDPDKARLLALLQLTVRGVPFIYYGDEIGMPHLEIPPRHGKDPVASRFRWMPGWLSRRLGRAGILVNRDECRPPMAWSSERHAGFSTGQNEPWLPVHPESHLFSVSAQADDPGSLLNTYRRLLHLRRRRPALHSGSLELVPADLHPPSVLGYRRSEQGGDLATVLLNFSDRPAAVDLRPHLQGAGRLVSSLDPEDRPAGFGHTLRPFEGIAVLGENGR
jgi:oligo-1,6-glucosidase/alpha-glucosidase